MIVYCSSDWHNQPDELSEKVKEFIEKAKIDADLIVGVGDLFDLMEHPWREFVNCKAVQEFKDRLEGKKFVYVAGNHDPARYVRKVVSGPNIEIRSHDYPLLIDVGGERTTYHFTHGHQWGIWFWLWKLSDILLIVAPSVYQRLVNRDTPRKAKDREEKEKYNWKTGVIHSRASQFAEQNDVTVVIGHTHKPWVAGSWKGFLMYDDGDMLDSRTYLRIEDTKVERLQL